MNNSKSFYLSVWRWHFYAGLYTVPFLLMLAITGLMMLYSPVVEKWTNQDLFHVQQVSNSPISYEDQKTLVAQAYPNDLIKSVHSPRNTSESTRFQVIQDGEALSVFVDPYQGKVLGDISISDSLYSWADNTHGTFMIGDTGDKLIEIAISFTVLLVITGAYLWWPRGTATLKESLKISCNKGRAFWKDLHSVIGIWVSIILLFFCISGLAWASVWGGSMLQAWSTFPMQQSASNVSSELTHNDLNVKGLKQVPWGLEQTSLPESEGTNTPDSIGLDKIVSKTKALGFTQFQVFFPTNKTGVYTSSASSMSKDIENATDDRTVHFDQYTGDVIVDIGYDDYSLAAKAMAVGISLHMGQWGLLNYIVNTLFCLAVIMICVTGIVMWWSRKPAGKFALSAPQKPKDLALWKHATWIILLVSILFPLGAIAIVAVIVIDRILLLIAPKLKAIFN